jgi:hypothetical protein
VIPLLVGVYLLVGFLLAMLAVRQGQPRNAATILLWTGFWPAGFILARVLNPPADMDTPYTLRHFGVYFVAVTVPVALSYLASQILPVPFARSFFTCMGGCLVAYASLRPHWFWGLARTQEIRLLLGDRLTRLLFLAVGAVLLWLGLFTDLQFPPR